MGIGIRSRRRDCLFPFLNSSAEADWIRAASFSLLIFLCGGSSNRIWRASFSVRYCQFIAVTQLDDAGSELNVFDEIAYPSYLSKEGLLRSELHLQGCRLAMATVFPNLKFDGRTAKKQDTLSAGLVTRELGVHFLPQPRSIYHLIPRSSNRSEL